MEHQRKLYQQRGYSEDLLPKTQSQRTWKTFNYFTLWMGSVHNVPNYVMVGGFFILGLSTFSIMLAIILSAFFIAAVMVLNGAAGSKYGVPFANPTRSFIEYMYQNDPDKNFLQKLYDEDYFGTVGEQYFLDWNTIVSSMTPSAIQPISEVIANYSLFTGTPIIPPVMESQLPESRYNRNTTELAKGLSRMLSGINPLLDSNITQRLISPPAIDYLIAGYGGSLGRDLWSFLDTVAQKAGVVDKVNAPAKSIEDLPLIGAFMVKYPNAGSRSLNDFFEKAEKFEQTLASIKSLMKEGTATSTQRAEFLLMNADYGRLTNIRGAIADLSRGIRTIHFVGDIPPEDKRRMIDSMYLDMITLAKGGLDVIKAVEQTNRAMRKEQ